MTTQNASNTYKYIFFFFCRAQTLIPMLKIFPLSYSQLFSFEDILRISLKWMRLYPIQTRTENHPDLVFIFEQIILVYDITTVHFMSLCKSLTVVSSDHITHVNGQLDLKAEDRLNRIFRFSQRTGYWPSVIKATSLSRSKSVGTKKEL